jgi:(p)ppGpp synthase/HD superfamily hydrolase
MYNAHIEGSNMNNHKKQTALMLAIVAEAFKDILDKSDEPYFNHCYSVMYLLGPDAPEERKQIALGHDLFEDTKITKAFLRESGFSERVIAGIDAMTKHRGQSGEEYEKQIMANKDAVFVKMADLTHNSDIRRIKGEPDEKDFARTAKYRVFFNKLKRFVGLQNWLQELK